MSTAAAVDNVHRGAALFTRRSRRAGMLEIALIAGLYLAGELCRGLARGGEATAVGHAAEIVRLESRLHVFDEVRVQHAIHQVYALPGLLGYAYLTLHLAVTAAVLAWVYRRRRFAYRRLRNALLLANALAVVGYTIFPTAPPRLAGVGLADTVSGSTSIDLGSSLVSDLYNPYAAVPSMHIGFALLVGAAIWRLARSPVVRLAGLLYPCIVLLATGNHFFFDAAAGAGAAAAAAAAVALVAAIRERRADVRLAAPLEVGSPHWREPEDLAA
jgi:hypothetical protein